MRRTSGMGLSFPPFTRAVKQLLIANGAVFLAVALLGAFLRGDTGTWINFHFGLVPALVVRGWLWQLVTYAFLHEGLWHILFNMLALWMFGTPVEQTWGTRRFLQYYFLCGVGAGICVVLVTLLFGNSLQPTIGASGAIYGLLLAYGMLFPEQEILFMFLFPMKAKYLVILYGAIAFLGTFQTGGTVSNLAHLGGMIFGFVYIRTQFRSRRATVRAGSGFSLSRAWKDYKLQRAKKKFQVYMKKHGSDGPWVN
jgi:membrane associated rhomboid family serine protease